MVFPETDHHLLERINQIIDAVQEESTKEKCRDLKKVIVERVETRQKEAMMYLVSTLDLGDYLNEETLSMILSLKTDKMQSKK
ncbi:MAG: hypothetical protein LGR52_12110 [Candidatus Thiosymbion ectosymbiont of Robbea hypermnestra]|nr:hypothetical protein [Candidatus Thiosymbion ectosymbiont of Robbea hypermnestra]